MCNTNEGLLYFVRQSIKADERKVTNFGHADDRLSRCTSEIVRCQRDWAEAAYYDRAYDGGEFSGKACYDGMRKEIDKILAKYGFVSTERNGYVDVSNAYVQFIDALQEVCSGRQLHFEIGLV